MSMNSGDEPQQARFKFIICLSPGRSGTKYLAKIFSSCSSVRAFHEPDPKLSCPRFAQGELDDAENDRRIAAKVEAMFALAEAGGACHCHVETDHTILHLRWQEVTEKLLQGLKSHERLGVVILRRNLAEVVKSRLELGHGTLYYKNKIARVRGIGWIYSPDSSACELKLPKLFSGGGDCAEEKEAMTPMDIVCGYVLNVEKVAENFIRKYSRNTKIGIFDTTIDSINEVESVRRMMQAFNLHVNDADLANVVGKRVNERTSEKNQACKRFQSSSFSVDDCKRGLLAYRKLLAQENRNK